jgi:hypothetical protein
MFNYWLIKTINIVKLSFLDFALLNMEFKEVFVKFQLMHPYLLKIVLFFMEFKEVLVEIQLTHP